MLFIKHYQIDLLLCVFFPCLFPFCFFSCLFVDFLGCLIFACLLLLLLLLFLFCYSRVKIITKSLRLGKPR